jgi:hypothetical protein
MGLAQGTSVGAKIHAARRALPDLEVFRLQQPRLLPYWLYRWLAEQRAASFLAGPLQRDFPAMRDRLAGIAEGSGLSVNAVSLFNVFEALLSSVGGCTACPGACSAVAIRGSRSATGEPIVAHNFDYLPLVQPFYVVRDSRPHGKLRSFEFTTAPLAGAVDGMNEAGLCITYNYAFAFDEPATPAAPISMAISTALERCGTVADAADFIASKPRFGGGLLMLCDASGDIASLELSSTRSYIRRPAEGEDVLFHTNAFASNRMREVQVAQDAVYTDRAPTPLRGRRLHQSSERRDERFRQLLADGGAFTIDELGAVMADHGAAGIASDDTPCIHGSYWYTTACLQLLPKSRQIRVAYDTACNAKFEEFEL